MKVIQATAMGFCFGVREALALARRQPDPAGIAIWGEIVHNESVQGELAELGYAAVAEDRRDELPAASRLLLTPHGVSERERERLLAGGKELIDTTCPFVRRVHGAARRLEEDGYHVVVIGKPGHVEVQGIVGDLAAHTVISRSEEARALGHARIGVVCQTTVMQREAHAIVDELRRLNPEAELAFVDTICEPTKHRIQALELMLTRCEAVVVVGGRHSNNTRQLVRLCAERGVPAFHVQGAADLGTLRLAGFETVGLTAGTSTPPERIAEVRRALEALPISLPVRG